MFKLSGKKVLVLPALVISVKKFIILFCMVGIVHSPGRNSFSSGFTTCKTLKKNSFLVYLLFVVKKKLC